MRAFVLLFALGIATAAAGDDVAAARQHYQKGTALYELSKFREAAAEYEEAYKAKPDPALLFNIGQAYRLADEREAALRSYRSYLRKLPTASNRAEVEGYIERLQKAIDEQRAAAAAAPKPEPQPAPATTTTTTVEAPANQALVATPPPSERKPVYKQWWLWTAVGVVVAGGAVGLAVAFTTPKNASGPANTVPVGLQ